VGISETIRDYRWEIVAYTRTNRTTCAWKKDEYIQRDVGSWANTTIVTMTFIGWKIAPSQDPKEKQSFQCEYLNIGFMMGVSCA